MFIRAIDTLEPLLHEANTILALYIFIGGGSPENKKKAFDTLTKNKALEKKRDQVHDLINSQNPKIKVTALAEILSIIDPDLAQQIATQIKSHVIPQEHQDIFNLGYYARVLGRRALQLEKFSDIVEEKTRNSIKTYAKLDGDIQIGIATFIRRKINVALRQMNTYPFDVTPEEKNAQHANQAVNRRFQKLLPPVAKAFNEWPSRPKTISAINIPAVDEENTLASSSKADTVSGKENKENAKRSTPRTIDKMIVDVGNSGHTFKQRSKPQKKSNFKWRGALIGTTVPAIPTIMMGIMWCVSPQFALTYSIGKIIGLGLLAMAASAGVGSIVENCCCIKDDALGRKQQPAYGSVDDTNGGQKGPSRIPVANPRLQAMAAKSVSHGGHGSKNVSAPTVSDQNTHVLDRVESDSATLGAGAKNFAALAARIGRR